MAASGNHVLAALGEEGQAAGGVAQEAVSSMTCLPLLSRLGEGKGAGDHEQQQCTVKEEIMRGGGSATSDLAQSGVDLSIGLPVGGSCIEDAIMEEKGDEEEEEGDDIDDDEVEEYSLIDDKSSMNFGAFGAMPVQQTMHDPYVKRISGNANAIKI